MDALPMPADHHTGLSARKYTLMALLSLSLMLLQACGSSTGGNYQSHGTNGSGMLGTNQNATFTGKLIFVKNRNIFVLDGKTNQLTQLTTGNATLQPALSLDGTTLAFEIRKPGNDYSDIATMPVTDSTTPTALTDNSLHVPPGVDTPAEGGDRSKHYEFWAENPIWTSDGHLIFLTDFFKGAEMTPRFANPTCPGISQGPNADWILDMGIGELPANAQALPALKNPPEQLAWPYCKAGGDQDLSLRPGVSDTEILFTSFAYIGQSDLVAQLSLLILSPDGNHRLIQLSPADPNTIPLEPSWSPDGKYITYIRHENGEDNLYLMPVPDTTITGTPNNEFYSLESGGKDTYSTYYQQSQKLAEGLYGNPVWSDSTHLVVMEFDPADQGGAFDLFLESRSRNQAAS